MLKVDGMNGMAPEMHHEVYRLIGEWHGSDAAEQTAALPALVEKIVRLKEAGAQHMSRAAAHDTAEAA